MSNQGIISGTLRTDSPHLHGLIARFLNPPGLSYLSDVYREVFLCGGITETFTREVGVSFNPRPARIGSLLISEGELRDRETLACGMIATLDFDRRASLVAKYPELFGKKDGEVNSFLLSDLNNQAIQIALDIDMLRHLHMTPLAHSEILLIVENIKERSLSLGKSGRLNEILLGTLDRCLRTLL